MGFFSNLFGGGGPDFAPIEQGFRDFQERQLAVEPGVTRADRDLAAESIGATRDIALSELQAVLPQILEQTSGQAGARGLGGSAIEAGLRASQGAAAHRNIADVISRASIAQGQALQQGSTPHPAPTAAAARPAGCGGLVLWPRRQYCRRSRQ
ncbi:MAG: hypothetical protein ACYSUI_19050 [Planctomycetota bacterium]|jgi:hypothetical protein